jgi:hypothetical protein
LRLGVWGAHHPPATAQVPSADSLSYTFRLPDAAASRDAAAPGGTGTGTGSSATRLAARSREAAHPPPSPPHRYWRLRVRSNWGASWGMGFDRVT